MHPVDSKDIAFQIAGICLKEGVHGRQACLLEPINNIEIRFRMMHGKVMGDLSSRRGRSRASRLTAGSGHQGAGSAKELYHYSRHCVH